MPERNDDLSAMYRKIMPILIRRRWWILGTFFTVTAIALSVAFMMPSKFRSEATIFIQSQKAPNQYVISNSTSNTMDDLDAITNQILSRGNLIEVINEFNLYPGLRKDMTPSDLAKLMRDSIEVTPMNKNPEKRTANAFMIAFTASNPQTAQKVTSRITSLFIEGNQQAVQGTDTGLTTFLSSELDAAKKDLDQQEALVRDFKMKNLGQLPEQEQGNLQILAGLQSQLQTLEANLSRARQQQTYIQTMLAQPAPVSATGTQLNTPPSPVTALRTELATLRSQRDDLLSRYSPAYPDVVSLNQRIREDEAQLKRLIAAQPPTQPAAESSDPAIAQLKSQLEATRLEIAQDQQQEASLQSQIAGYSGRLNLAPVRSQQLQEVLRNYDSAKQKYTDLMNKASESQLATKLAKRQIDAQFQIIDSASLPDRPASHQRIAIALGGMVAGFIIGLVLAFIVDSRNKPFYTEKDLKAAYSVPLVVAVPPFRTDDELSKIASRTRMEWLFASTLLVLALAGQAFIVYRG
ncbi:MAG TPA: Wzz/FepE/Etk N-terminal domain-containing protein [Terracidiphilus sp.]